MHFQKTMQLDTACASYWWWEESGKWSEPHTSKKHWSEPDTSKKKFGLNQIPVKKIRNQPRPYCMAQRAPYNVCLSLDRCIEPAGSVCPPVCCVVWAYVPWHCCLVLSSLRKKTPAPLQRNQWGASANSDTVPHMSVQTPNLPNLAVEILMPS